MNSLAGDIRYAVRTLLKKPAFTAIIVLTLALGIGANTAVFSVVNAILFTPPDVKDPDSLVRLWATEKSAATRGYRCVSAIDCADWRVQTDVFDEIALFQEDKYNLTGDQEAEVVSVIRATANLLPMLGFGVRLGRLHAVHDDAVGAPPVVLLTESLWKRRFAADADIVGKTVILDGHSIEVVGVLSPEADRTWVWEEVDVWAPLPIDPADVDRTSRAYKSFARLSEGVSVQEAQAEMDGIAARLEAAYPDSNADTGVWVQPLADNLVGGDDRLALRALLAAVGFVLLIACANVANLLLAKSGARGRELTIRASVGASRGRIIRQLLTESVILALAGGACGVLLGTWGVTFLAHALSGRVPNTDGMSINLPVLLYTLALTLLAALIFGLVPAWYATKLNLGQTLNASSGRLTTGASRRRLQSGLVIGQISIAMLLVICTGLMTRTLLALRSVDLGYDPQKLLTMRIDLAEHRYGEPSQQVDYFRSALAAIELLPGVNNVGAVNNLPLGGVKSRCGITLEGDGPGEPGSRDLTGYVVTAGDYFETMRIPLLSGRLFSDHDGPDSTVVLVNEHMARQFWPNQNALGRRLRIGWNNPDGPWLTVVGVVGSVRHEQLDGLPESQMFLRHQQSSEASMTVLARTAGDPVALVGAVRNALAQLDRDQPVHKVCPMTDYIDAHAFDTSMLATLLGALSTISLSLACVGLYGVISYAVARRTQEIGLRMALGAEHSDILWLVLRSCLGLCLLGVFAGLVLSVLAAGPLESLLYEVSPADPMTFSAVSALLIAAAMLAGYLPARRAAKVDPMVALRCE
ncbi:MAG: ABC transporter permease [Phycisphaerales bacterium]|nr:MAG: ABC transporter permease [Phycisphaerales bacterium]